MNDRVSRYPDSEALAQAAAELFIELVNDAIAERGQCHVALAGGATPRATYAALARETCAARVDWSRVQVYWGDERCVPPNSLDSDFRLAWETLLAHVPIPAEHVHRMRGELEPRAAMEEYDALLHQAFPGVSWPRFDLILLGLGTDGHTASLFPGTAALAETERWVAANFVPQLDAWRLTLTLPAINHAANILFLVSGARKAEILREALRPADHSAPLAARRVHPIHGTLRWLVDAEAAALLGTGYINEE